MLCVVFVRFCSRVPPGAPRVGDGALAQISASDQSGAGRLLSHEHGESCTWRAACRVWCWVTPWLLSIYTGVFTILQNFVHQHSSTIYSRYSIRGVSEVQSDNGTLALLLRWLLVV